jgi:hypothetical protein
MYFYKHYEVHILQILTLCSTQAISSTACMKCSAETVNIVSILIDYIGYQVKEEVAVVITLPQCLRCWQVHRKRELCGKYVSKTKRKSCDHDFFFFLNTSLKSYMNTRSNRSIETKARKRGVEELHVSPKRVGPDIV